MNVVIFVTAANKKEADKIASALINNKLAACVNVIANVNSLFWWQGKAAYAKETLLIVKTRRALMHKLIKKVKSLHSYAVPEIIALPIVSGDKKYLRWLNESTS